MNNNMARCRSLIRLHISPLVNSTVRNKHTIVELNGSFIKIFGTYSDLKVTKKISTNER